MKTVILVALLLLLSSVPVFGGEPGLVISSYSVNPSTLFPGDTGKLVVTVTNTGTRSAEIKEAVLYGNGLKVLSPGYSRLGTLTSGGSVELTFVISGMKEGVYYPTLVVRGNDSTLQYPILVTVDSTEPEVLLDTGILYVNEVNRINFTVINPRSGDLTSIKVQPIVDGNVYPEYLYFDKISGGSSARGVFYLYTTKPIETVQFSLQFNNGENVRYTNTTAPVNPLPSREIQISLEKYPNEVLRYDTVVFSGNITNLRQDTIYSLIMSIEGDGIVSSGDVVLPALSSMDSVPFTFRVTPVSSGPKHLTLTYMYSDVLGKIYTGSTDLYIQVPDKDVLSLNGVETKKDGRELNIIGDVSNLGNYEVKGVTVSVLASDSEESYFIGALAPSDFNSFDVNIPVKENLTTITISIQFVTGVGQLVTIQQNLPVKEKPVLKEPEIPKKYYILIGLISVLVLVVVGYSWKRATQ